MSNIPPAYCPHLPEPKPGMNWRDLNRYRDDRGGEFYLTALRYGNHLWRDGLPARAVLALNRGLYAPLYGTEPELRAWPLPYRALLWMFEHYERSPGFGGNPRVSYQHQAGRMRGQRLDQRKWRAWACWHLARQALPHLPSDPGHDIAQPDYAEIYAGLLHHGIPGEADLWQSVLPEEPAPPR